MKYIGTVTLMLILGVAGIYAQPGPVNMTVSGTAAASTISLQSGTPASEYQLAGDGTLGSLTLRAVSSSMNTPQISRTCSGPTKVYFPVVAGAVVFRSQNGDLLMGNLTGGSDCIDFAAGQALCIRIFQVTGGSGHFQKASGTLTLTMTVAPVLADSTNNPVFFAVTGAITGAVPGVAMEAEFQEVRR
jgi:hypothetical protein